MDPVHYSFQKETFSLLGIDEKTIIFAKPDTQISADVLLIPSIAIKDPSFYCPPWIKNFLCNQFLDTTFEKSIYPKRIYISRNQAQCRRIINESEMLQLLHSLGFVCLNFENYSVQQQAQFINAAEIIIGPHGSGFANLVFAQPNTHVIELFNEEDVNNLFSRISQSLMLHHYQIICCNTLLSDEEKNHEDMIVDLEYLKELLTTIITQ